MKTLIVYDSYYRNTEKIAMSMKKVLRAGAVRAGRAKPGQLKGLDLLIVGSPTRAFQATPAVRAFLNRIPSGGLEGVSVAAFDTRISLKDSKSRILKFLMRFFGYAAEPTLKKLVKKGGHAAAKPAGFIVQGTEGPLKAGEEKRAGVWARACARVRKH